jgi:hypothetical protein
VMKSLCIFRIMKIWMEPSPLFCQLLVVIQETEAVATLQYDLSVNLSFIPNWLTCAQKQGWRQKDQLEHCSVQCSFWLNQERIIPPDHSEALVSKTNRIKDVKCGCLWSRMIPDKGS